LNLNEIEHFSKVPCIINNPDIILLKIIGDGLVKSRNTPLASFPQRRESSDFRFLWMPAAVYPALDAGQA